MKALLGTKEHMTQLFDESGKMHAATILRVAPHTISQLKNAETDGYEAVQVATVSQKEARVSKAEKGHFGAAFKHAVEFRPKRNETLEGKEKGSTFDASIFEVGDVVAVSAISKGKGFQGVVKRHNFAGGPKSHGQKHSLRAPGSIGSTGPQRVFKGTKMAGRMGGERVTVKNLKVLHVDLENELLYLSGAVPGRRGTVVEVRSV